jgi:hypothetical protein
MHSLGLIPENAMGWRYAPAAALPAEAAWQAPGHDDGDWLAGSAPFPNDALLQKRLAEQVRRHGPAEAKHEGQVRFRYAFELDRRDYKPGTAFKMTVTSSDNAAKVWLNGRELKAEKRGQYALVLEKQPPPGGLRPGRNVLAVSAKGTGDGKGKLLDVVLCEEHVPPGAEKAAEQLTERVVVRKAVVCDLCSSLAGGPRCVSACPHDAAFRLDFRREGQEMLHGYRERR